MKLTDLTEEEIKKHMVINYRENRKDIYKEINRANQFKAINAAIQNFNKINFEIMNFAKKFHSYNSFYTFPSSYYDEFIRRRDIIKFNTEDFLYSTEILEIIDIDIFITEDTFCGVGLFLKIATNDKNKTVNAYLNVMENNFYFDTPSFKNYMINKKIEYLIECTTTTTTPRKNVEYIVEIFGISKEEAVEKYKCAFLENLETI